MKALLMLGLMLGGSFVIAVLVGPSGVWACGLISFAFGLCIPAIARWAGK